MLDALNDDCRRLVLGYVPVRDIMRAERVSRSWQQEVLKYLQSVRIRIRIENSECDYRKTQGSHNRILELKADEEWFDQVTTKLASSIVVSDCFNECTLLTLLQNCPNLEHFVLRNMCYEIDDDCVRKFIGNDLEELTIYFNKAVTGRCLLRLPSNFKSLSLMCCDGLQLQHLLPAVKKCPSLKKLDLNGLAPEIFQSAHLLLDELPNLRELRLKTFNVEINLKDFAQSIIRLSNLKRLDLSENPYVSDEWLVAIRRGCWQLQELNLAFLYKLSAGAVVTTCEAVGSALAALDVSAVDLTDEHVLVIIWSCPNLKSLDVKYCPLSANFAAAAMQLCAARAQPLRLRGVCKRKHDPYSKHGNTNVYPGLIIHYGGINSDDDSSDIDVLCLQDSDGE